MGPVDLRLELVSQFSEFAGGLEQFRLVEDYVNASSVRLVFVSPKQRGAWNVNAFSTMDSEWRMHLLAFVGVISLTEIEALELDEIVAAAVQSAPSSALVDWLADSAEADFTGSIFMRRFEALNRFKSSNNGVSFTVQTNPFRPAMVFSHSRDVWLHATFVSPSPTIRPALEASLGQLQKSREVVAEFGWGGHLGDFAFMIENTF